MSSRTYTSQAQFNTIGQITESNTSLTTRPDAIASDYLTAFTLGPQAIGNTGGTLVSNVWRVYYDPSRAEVFANLAIGNAWGPDQAIMVPSSTPVELTACFDQQGQVFVAYQAEGTDGSEIWIYWYNPTLGSYTQQMIALGQTPRAILDNPQVLTDSDILLFYVPTSGEVVEYVQQSDAYGIPYTTPLAANANTYLEEILQTVDFRIRVIASVRNPTTASYSLTWIETTLYPVGVSGEGVFASVAVAGVIVDTTFRVWPITGEGVFAGVGVASGSLNTLVLMPTVKAEGVKPAVTVNSGTLAAELIGTATTPEGVIPTVAVESGVLHTLYILETITAEGARPTVGVVSGTLAALIAALTTTAEGVKPTVAVTSGSLTVTTVNGAMKAEGVHPAVVVISGSLAVQLIGAAAVAEGVKPTVTVASGVLENTDIGYTSPAEGVKPAVTVASGSLTVNLIQETLTNEGVSNTVTVDSGTLASEIVGYVETPEGVKPAVVVNSGSLVVHYITETMTSEGIKPNVSVASGALVTISGVTAQYADNFVDTFALAAQYDYVSGNPTQVGYINNAFLTTRVRYGRSGGSDQNFINNIAALGAQSTPPTKWILVNDAVGSYPEPAGITSALNSIVQYIDAMEGPDEPDLFWVQGGSPAYNYNGAYWPTGPLQFQKDLFTFIKAGTGNLLNDPSMNAPPGAGDTAVGGWHNDARVATNLLPFAITADTTQSYAGSQCLKMSFGSGTLAGGATASAGAAQTSPAVVQAGQVYTFSAYINGNVTNAAAGVPTSLSPGFNVYVTVVFSDSTYTSVTAPQPQAPPTSGWQQYTGTLKIPNPPSGKTIVGAYFGVGIFVYNPTGSPVAITANPNVVLRVGFASLALQGAGSGLWPTIPVVGFSLGTESHVTNPPVGQINTALVSLGIAYYCNYLVTHQYPGNTAGVANLPDASLASMFINAPNGQWGITGQSGKGLYATETGYQAPSVTPNDGLVSYRAKAKYTLRIFGEYWNIRLVVAGAIYRRVCIYVLDARSGLNATDQSWSLINPDGSFTPALTAIEYLVNLLTDYNNATFTLGTLPYTVTRSNGSPLPSSARNWLFQKSNGRFYILLWNNVSSWNGSTDVEAGTSVPITITFGGTLPTTVNYYTPTFSNAVQNTYTTPSTISTYLLDHIQVFEVIP